MKNLKTLDERIVEAVWQGQSKDNGWQVQLCHLPKHGYYQLIAKHTNGIIVQIPVDMSKNPEQDVVKAASLAFENLFEPILCFRRYLENHRDATDAERKLRDEYEVKLNRIQEILSE